MSKETLTLDQRAEKIKAALTANEGKIIERGKEVSGYTAETLREGILQDMPEAVKQVDALRAGSKDRRSIDLSLGEYAREKWGFALDDNGSPESLYMALGIKPSEMTVESLMTMPEFPDGYRWLVPEVIREAVRLGLRRNPMYPSWIAAEETVGQPTVIMPHVNMSDATVRKVGEAETIPTGTVSFGQKTVKLNKVGTGIKMTDEVRQYVSLNILSLYMQDAGVKLGLALDTLALDVLVNGDQAGGTEAAAVIGVDNTTNGIVYKDILRAWIRMGRIGRMPNGMLSNEDTALEVLLLEEFKGTLAGTAVLKTLNLQVPIPQNQSYWIHGGAPSGEKLMLIDGSSALIKLNAQGLRIESERIANRQIEGSYMTLTTGFANLFRDARLIIDGSQAFSGAGFPSWMDVNGAENVVIS